jgi:hypothetical protein
MEALNYNKKVTKGTRFTYKKLVTKVGKLAQTWSCYPWAVWVVQNHPRSLSCRTALLYLILVILKKVFFFRAPPSAQKNGGPGKPAGLRNGHLLRRGAFATPALKRRRSTNLYTGPEDGLDSSTAPEGRW